MSIFSFIVPPVLELRNGWVRKKLKALKPGLHILDVGCGPAPYRADCAHLKYAAQDFAAYDGRGDKAGLHDGESWSYGKLDYVGDAWDIKANDKSFDAILCTEVLEHIPYPVEALREFARLLKKGGTLILTVPVNCLPHQTPYFFYHGISRQVYEKVGGESGLKLEEFITYPSVAQFLFLECMRYAMAQKNPVKKWLMLGYFLPLGLFAKFTAPRNLAAETYPAAGALMILRKVK